MDQGVSSVITPRRKRTSLVTSVLACLAVAGAVLLAGCGLSSQPVAYAPAAYGVPGHCYYVNSPAEALALRAAGLCPSSWAPTAMPGYWLDEYYAYYDSPAYYNTYVPRAYRTIYIHTETRYYSAHRATILTAEKSATYRSSSGRTVKGATITSKARFGSGTSFGQTGARYGGGSGRSSSHTSYSSSRSSFGGGSGRSSFGSSSTGRSSGFGGGSGRIGRR
jgi:hypothetical protein